MMIPRARTIVIGLALAAMLEGALAAEPAAAAQPLKRLDLRAPDITKLYTPEQLNRMLGSTVKDNDIANDIEEVEVEGQRERTPARSPTVWGGIAAPVWAILNPTQAWRIFAPLPPDQTSNEDLPPITTRGYLEPAATIPR
jgi:hypothetical protein